MLAGHTTYVELEAGTLSGLLERLACQPTLVWPCVAHAALARERFEHVLRATQVWSPGGRLLATDYLIAQLQALENARARRRTISWFARRLPASWPGFGPVPGVHKYRGGKGRRRPHTTPERRAAFVIDGEPPVRAARNAVNLPTSHDTRWPRAPRCWKDQRRGRKAWDR